MAYGDLKDLAKRKVFDVLRDKAFNIAKDPKYGRYQRSFAAMVYKFFDKKSADSLVNEHANKEHPLDLATQKLTEELHQPVIKKLKKDQFILDSKTICGALI